MKFCLSSEEQFWQSEISTTKSNQEFDRQKKKQLKNLSTVKD
jgi:hypothetical protein